MANGNEILQQVIGIQTNGQPSGQTQSLTLTQLTNFEGSTTIATSQSVTTSTTLVSSGMSVNLISGATYVFDLYISVTNGSSVSITGSILCAASGTFNLSFAQNVSNATATTLNAGSNFWIDRVS